MSLLNIFRRKPTRTQQNRETMQAVRDQISHNQEEVYAAVEQIGLPCNGRRVADYLGWDSCSVTNRLAELTRKGRLKVAYNKRGLDGIWRHYYVVAK